MAHNDERFHSIAESEMAIADLNPCDVIKLRQYARARLVFNSRELSENELISDAIARTLNGDRQWNLKLTIIQHLIGVMRSIAGDQRRTKSTKNEVLTSDLDHEDYQTPFEAADSTDETTQIDNQIAVEKIITLFEGDNDSTMVLKGLLLGEKRSQTILKTGLSEQAYGSARKRITRKALAMRERGQI